MAYIFYKNTILSSNIDFYCLVCETHLRRDDDVIAHIAKPIHKKCLNSIGYVEKFKDHHIRKINKSYYCEFCNMLLSTSATVAFHLEEQTHKVNKDGQALKRVADTVIAFDEILINERAWNGFVDDTCTICNTEFDKEDIHKSQPMHILNLIQINILFSGKNIYRKIDEKTIHCLTCNLIVAFDSINSHFSRADHKKLYEKCREEYDNIFKLIETTNENEKVITLPLDEILVEKAKDILTTKNPQKPQTTVMKEAVIEIKKTRNNKLTSGINETVDNKLTNELKKTVENKSTNESKKVLENKEPAKSSTPKKQSENAKRTEKTFSENSITVDFDVNICETLGVKNYILEDDEGRAWCILCEWMVPGVSFNYHLKSKHHEAMLKLHKKHIEKRNINTENIPSEKTPELSNINENKLSNIAENDIDSSIVDNITEFAKKYVDIDLERSFAYCRKCSLSIECSVEIISDHIATHNKKPTTKNTDTKHKPFLSGSNKEYSKDEKSGTTLYTRPVFINKNKQDKAGTKPNQDSKATNKRDKKEDRKDSLDVVKHETKTENPKSKTDQTVKAKSKSVKAWTDEARAYAAKNNLLLDTTHNTVFCRVCKTRVPPPLRSMKEHVEGGPHKMNLKQNEGKEKPKKPPVLTRIEMQKFITSAVAVENIWMDIVINESFVLNVYSFDMIMKRDSMLRCQVCEASLTDSQIDTHKEMSSHKTAMLVTPVISSLPDEFVREIRTGLYHCGFCNLISASWDDLQNHLICSDHREHKNAAAWRLRRYMPQILQRRQMRRQMQMDSFLTTIWRDLLT